MMNRRASGCMVAVPHYTRRDHCRAPKPFVAIEPAKLAAILPRCRHWPHRPRPAAPAYEDTQERGIARMQIGRGAAGLCCAKLAEAEVSRTRASPTSGAVPVNHRTPTRAGAPEEGRDAFHHRRQSGGRRRWSRAMAGEPAPLDVLVKVDVGFHRCGIDPEAGPPCRDYACRGALGVAVSGAAESRRHPTTPSQSTRSPDRRARDRDSAWAGDARSRSAAPVEEISVGSTAHRTVHHH